MLSWKASRRILFLMISLLPAPLALAENNLNYKSEASVMAPAPSTNPRDTDYAGWKFSVSPYIWALNMNGTVEVKSVRAPINQTFGDILRQLNWAGMAWVDVNKDKFGIFFNALYASLSNGASDRYISAHVNNDFGLFAAGLSYEVYRKCFCSADCRPNTPSFALVPYIGARYTLNNVQLKVNTVLGNLRLSNNKHWTDPIIGARLNFDLTKAWLITLAGDIGGTNTISDYSYNVMGVIGYKPQTRMTRTTWYLGYRLLDQHYATGSSSNYFNWNMKLYGPLAGVAFAF